MFYLVNIEHNKTQEKKDCVYLGEYNDLNFISDFSYTLINKDTDETLVVDYLGLWNLYNKHKLFGVDYLECKCYVFSKLAIEFEKEIKLPSVTTLSLQDIYGELDLLEAKTSDRVVSYRHKSKLGDSIIVISTPVYIQPLSSSPHLFKHNYGVMEWLSLYKYCVGVEISLDDIVYLGIGSSLIRLYFNSKILRYVIKLTVLGG